MLQILILLDNLDEITMVRININVKQRIFTF